MKHSTIMKVISYMITTSTSIQVYLIHPLHKFSTVAMVVGFGVVMFSLSIIMRELENRK